MHYGRSPQALHIVLLYFLARIRTYPHPSSSASTNMLTSAQLKEYGHPQYIMEAKPILSHPIQVAALQEPTAVDGGCSSVLWCLVT